MTIEEVERKFGPRWVRSLKISMCKAVGPDGFIQPLDITADQIDDILSTNFGVKRGVSFECVQFVPNRLNALTTRRKPKGAR